MTWRLVLRAAIFALVGFPSVCQSQIFWQEDFEASQDFQYVVSNRFYRNTQNYFQEVTAAQLAHDYNPYQANTGVTFFAAEDTNDRGSDGLAEKIVTFDAIDTSGRGDLTFFGDFASSSNPNRNRFERNDGAILFYSTDGGTSWESALSFVSERDTNRNRRGHLVFQDPNFMGINAVNTAATETRSTIQSIGAGSGSALSNVFTTFSFTIPEADEVIFKILLAFDGANEEFAFDNFRLVGAIPEPETYALLFGCLSLLVILLKRRNR